MEIHVRNNYDDEIWSVSTCLTFILLLSSVITIRHLKIFHAVTLMRCFIRQNAVPFHLAERVLDLKGELYMFQ